MAAEALGLQVKTSQNTFQMEMKTRMKRNKPYGRDEGLRAVWRQQEVHSQLTLSI